MKSALCMPQHFHGCILLYDWVRARRFFYIFNWLARRGSLVLRSLRGELIFYYYLWVAVNCTTVSTTMRRSYNTILKHLPLTSKAKLAVAEY